jgi:hypothetical protein
MTRVQFDEVEYVGALIADTTADFYVSATCAGHALPFDRPLRAVSNFSVVPLLKKIVEVVHVVTAASNAPCGAD